MEQEGPSFWADIKKYEDTLDKDPNSYCFAPLSELYRKVGMVDDAIIIAKRGCDLHPEYVGGYMALGRAYFEKGMNPECRQALEKVVRVTPDNLLAQRILGQIYIDAGEVAAAEESLKTILAQNPDDIESRVLLNSLSRIAGAGAQPAFEAEDEHTADEGFGGIARTDEDLLPGEDDDDEIIDLLDSEIIEELTEEQEEIEEAPFSSEFEISDPDVSSGGEMDRRDPLLTVTLAELYVSQGLPERAKAIYSELLEADPNNAELKSRLVALEMQIRQDETIAGKILPQPDYSGSGALAPAEVRAVADTLPMMSAGGSFADESISHEELNQAGNEERIIYALEGWLENIRRRRDGS